MKATCMDLRLILTTGQAAGKAVQTPHLEAGREASMILMTHQEWEVEREVSMTLLMIPQDPAAGEAVN